MMWPLHRGNRANTTGTGMRVTAAAALAVFVLFACPMTDRATARETGGKGGERPVLFLGNDSLPPLNFLKGGEPTGVVVDLARALAKRMRRPVEIRLMNWAEAQQMVLDGRADALLQINASPERLEVYDFSEALLTSEFSIFTSSARSGINSFFDLRGLRVGVEKMGLPDLLLRQDPRITVENIPDFARGFEMLAAGDLDAVVADRRVGSYVLAENNIRGIKLAEKPVSYSDSAIAVKKGDTILLEEINAALADIRRNGAYDEILESWRAREVVFKTLEQLRKERLLIGAISAALIAALLSVAALAREIRRRKRVEKALREGEERLRLFIEHAPASLAMFDRKMRYISASRRWRSDYQLGDRDLTGLSHYEVFPEIGEEWKTVHRRALSGEVVCSDNDRFDRADGSMQWLRWEVRPWYDASGEIGGIVVFTEDTTARKLAEDALRESEERFRLALRNAPVSVAAQDLDLRYIWAYNQRTARPDQIIGHFDHEIFTAEEAEHVTAVKRRVLEEDVELREQMWFNRPSGRIFLDVSWTPTRDAAGRVTGVASATVDLTPIKLAEEKLRESEERLRTLGDNLPQGAIYRYAHDTEGHPFFEYISAGIEQLTGITPEEILRDAGALHNTILPEDRVRLVEVEAESRRSLSRLELEVRQRHRKTGEMRWVLLRSVPRLLPNGSTVWDGVHFDITERKRAEEALRESEELLRMALRAAGAGVWSWNIVNGSIAWSPENYDLYGLDWNHGPSSHSDWERCLHPDDLARANRAIRDTIEGRTSEYRAEFRVVHPALGVRWLLGVGRVEYAPDGLPLRMLGINLDITERKQAELALQESEERYRSFFENSLDGIFITAPNGGILSANQAACRMLGYTEEEMCGLGRDGIVDSRDPRLTGLLEERSRMRSCRGELTLIRKDGAGFEVELSSGIFHNSRGEDRATVVFRDVTERKRLEEELRRSHDELELRVRERTAELHLTNRALRKYAGKLERLNAELNEFAWIASHDLREPLRKIHTFGDRLSRIRDSFDERGRDDLDRMIKSVGRMSSLVGSLSSYANMTREIVTVQPVDLQGMAREAVSELEAVLLDSGGYVEIGELPTIEGDAAKMRLLFQNLISNAIKYIDDHEKPRIRITGRVMDGVCRIEVEDNGIGFEEQYLDRIFKPFQRLHGRSSRFEGTGMGLAICRKVADLHGGSITAKSKPWEGSTFIVTLPVEQGAGHNDGT